MAYGRSDEAAKDEAAKKAAGDRDTEDKSVGARVLVSTPVWNFAASSSSSSTPTGIPFERVDVDADGSSQPDGGDASGDFDSQPTNPSQEHPDHQRLWEMSIDGSQNSDRVLGSQSQ